jgi:phytoene dehydrogenase-like protein
MDFAQFVIMFKSLYFEGFSRPQGGVRTILSLLMNKLNDLGGEIRFKTPVSDILVNEKLEVCGVRALDEEFQAPVIFSSIGYPETVKLTPKLNAHPRLGRMTFLESIFVFDKKIPLEENNSTIVFYNNSSRYHYRSPTDYFDPSSAVVCYPDNYEPFIRDGEGTVRITYMANYHQWNQLPKNQYNEMKDKVGESSLELFKRLNPQYDGKLVFKDIFSPTTIERYTWHSHGTVYGSIDKVRDGRTPVKNLFIIGTDQGFLGIVGSMLSGISMANLHGLMGASE